MKIKDIVTEAGVGYKLARGALGIGNTIASVMSPSLADKTKAAAAQADELTAQQQAAAGASEAPPAYVKTFGDTRIPTGQRLKVIAANKQTYYKYPNGIWYWLAMPALPKGSSLNPLQQVPEKQAQQLDALNTTTASASFENLAAAKKRK